MIKPRSVPELTPEQEQALSESAGVVRGNSFVLMRPDVLLDWLGYSMDELRDELQPAVEQAEKGDLTEWNLQAFLAEMHRRHSVNPG